MIMKKFLIAILLLLPITATAQRILPPSLPDGMVSEHDFQTVCGNYDWFIKHNAENGFGDTIVFNGFSTETGVLSHLVVDKQKGSYSFFMSFSNAMICLVANGDMYELADIYVGPTY